MRKQQLAMFVSLLLVLVVAAAAQTTSQLDRVNVVRDADTIRVEMSSQGTLTPKVSTMDSPARVVVDLPETIMATRQKAISVGAQGVKGVRIGMDGQSHPTTRIVVDLEKACAYELTPGPAGKLVLSLHASADAKAIVPASTVASNTASSVQAEVAPAAKASASPNEYVFVEPSYQAQKTAVSDAPADRAQDAAAKFSDKTTPELLPVSMNAAQQAQSGTPSITPAVNLAAEQKAQAGQQSAAVGPKYTGEPISVNLKDVDLKDFFRLIHEISGLNVVLDPNVHGTLTIVLWFCSGRSSGSHPTLVSAALSLVVSSRLRA